MTFHEFYMGTHKDVVRKPKSWRWGQFVFNELHAVRPDVADRIRGSSLDPFYKNLTSREFWDAVALLWEPA